MDIPSFARISDPQISTRGAKYALVENNKLHGGDGKIRVIVGTKENPTSSPFGVSTYNNDDATRKNIEFIVTPHEEAKINSMYDWAITQLAAKSDKYFKRLLTKDEIIDCFKHPIIRKEQYPAKFKCKVDTAGKNAVRCWDADGKRCELPSDLRKYKLIAKVTFNHVWFMSKECGFVCLCTDLQLLDCENEECPFE
jgi:hypothetical protein